MLGGKEREGVEGCQEGGFPGAVDGQRLGALPKRYVPPSPPRTAGISESREGGEERGRCPHGTRAAEKGERGALEARAGEGCLRATLEKFAPQAASHPQLG